MLLPSMEDGRCRNLPQNDHPFVEIVEQPATQVRYRYISEKKGATRYPGPIPGKNSTNELKTSPAIKIHNYKGQAVVVVSCVTEDKPYRPHPHNLSGKEEEEGFKNGVYSLKVHNTEDQIIQFPNLGIECAKKQDVVASLKNRKSIKVDPFGTGFDHARKPSSIDLNVVRLCFQVFVKDSRHAFGKSLPAVVSSPIHSLRSNQILQICSLSHASAPVIGDFEMNLLCRKVNKDNIEIHFTEYKNGLEVWKGLGKFQPFDVHQQVAIKFRTPSYKDKEVKDPVNVQIRLYRPSDESYSNALDFILTPIVKSDLNLKRNSPKNLNDDFVSALMQYRNITPHEHSNSTINANHSQVHSTLLPTSRDAPSLQDTDGGGTEQKNPVHSPMQLYASSVVCPDASDSKITSVHCATIFGNSQVGETLNQTESTSNSHHPDVRFYDTTTYIAPLPSEQVCHQELQQQQDKFVHQSQLPHFYTLEQMRPSLAIAATSTAPYNMPDMEVDISLSYHPDNNPNVDMSTEPPALHVELNSTELATIESWFNPQNELSIL